MIDCPACAGPQALGGDCATCLGVTEITQEVFDVFMLHKEKQERYFYFVSEVDNLITSGFDKKMTFTVGNETLNYSGN
jgi:hypothetical protein